MNAGPWGVAMLIVLALTACAGQKSAVRATGNDPDALRELSLALPVAARKVLDGQLSFTGGQGTSCAARVRIQGQVAGKMECVAGMYVYIIARHGEPGKGWKMISQDMTQSADHCFLLEIEDLKTGRRVPYFFDNRCDIR